MPRSALIDAPRAIHHLAQLQQISRASALALGGANAHASAEAAQDPRSKNREHPVCRKRSVRKVRALQSADESWMDEGARIEEFTTLNVPASE
jgi:hypothetical protein